MLALSLSLSVAAGPRVTELLRHRCLTARVRANPLFVLMLFHYVGIGSPSLAGNVRVCQLLAPRSKSMSAAPASGLKTRRNHVFLLYISPAQRLTIVELMQRATHFLQSGEAVVSSSSIEFGR